MAGLGKVRGNAEGFHGSLSRSPDRDSLPEQGLMGLEGLIATIAVELSVHVLVCLIIMHHDGLYSQYATSVIHFNVQR